MDNVLEKIAGKISSETGRNSETMLFGLRVLWNFLAGYTVLIAASLITGIFPYAVIAAFSTSVFRIMSGGAHASSSNRCIVYGTIVFLILGFLAQQLEMINSILLINILIVFILVTGIPIIFKYAKSSISGKPLGTYTTGRKFRNLTISCLFLWAVLEILMSYNQTVGSQIFRNSSLLGVAYQIFSLTPWGYKTVAIVDRLLCKIHI